MRSAQAIDATIYEVLLYRLFLALVLLSVVILIWGGTIGCSRQLEQIPADIESLNETPKIFPDYCNITIPCNIAPMNFDVVEDVDGQILTLVFSKDPNDKKNEGNFIQRFRGREIRFSEQTWRSILQENVGSELVFSTYVRKEGQWRKFKDWTMRISDKPIDPWVSYRLIAPGYERYSELALWNRNVETFEERPFFSARLVDERTCVNCHAFQNYRTDVFLFHMRLTEGGTVFNVGGDLSKRDLFADGMLSGCSYPAWRPNSNHVAFSSNLTFQTFRSKSPDRIDVLDGYSDLYLYDVDKNSLRPVFPPSDDRLDTYPFWSSDGKTLYYCSAKNPGFKSTREDVEARKLEAGDLRKEFHYDLMKVAYDEASGNFGEPEVVFDAASRGKSALFPRVSPDGRYLLFTLTEYGCFPIWYRDSNLWLLDLSTGEAREIDEVNSSDEPDSYHAWNSTGDWIVFSSRRDDGSYTRLYFSSIDADGQFSKPFMLPQKDPEQTLLLTRSYNIPEFTIEPVKIPERTLLNAAKKSEDELEKAILNK